MQKKKTHTAVWLLLPKADDEVGGRGRAAQISWRFTLTCRSLIIKSGKGGRGRSPTSSRTSSPTGSLLLTHPVISCVLCGPPVHAPHLILMPSQQHGTTTHWREPGKARHSSETTCHTWRAYSFRSFERSMHSVLHWAERAHRIIWLDWCP